MKRILCLMLTAVLSLGGLAFGQEADQAAEQDSESTSTNSEAAPSKPFELKLSGDHQFSYRMPAYGDAYDYDGEMKMPMFRSELGLAVTEGQISLVSRWQLDNSPNLGQDSTDQWSNSTRVRNLENYIAWNPEKFRLGFGYQIYAWGVADGRNPTDNLNPRDYTTLEGTKPHKIPILSASANWYPTEEISLETVFEPSATSSVSPIDYQEELNSYGFSKVSYDKPDNKPSDFIAGGKLNYRSQAVDLSVSYLYDFDALYTPVISNASLLPSATDISLERKRIHRLGADAKTTIGKYGVWAETCYSLTGNSDTSDYSERLSRLDYTLGFDFSYGPQDDYYANFQYTGTVIPGFDSSANTDTSDMRTYYQRMLVGFLGSEREKYLQGLTWNTHWNLAEGNIVPTFTGAYCLPIDYDDSVGTRYGNLLLEPDIDIMPIDSFHIKVGAILSYAWVKKGGKVSLDTTTDSLGIYTPANNVFISVSYKWNYETTRK